MRYLSVCDSGWCLKGEHRLMVKIEASFMAARAHLIGSASLRSCSCAHAKPGRRSRMHAVNPGEMPLTEARTQVFPLRSENPAILRTAGPCAIVVGGLLAQKVRAVHNPTKPWALPWQRSKASIHKISMRNLLYLRFSTYGDGKRRNATRRRCNISQHLRVNCKVLSECGGLCLMKDFERRQ
jgi:hypothetical protein